MLLCHKGNHGKEILAFMDETRRRRIFEDVRIVCEDSVVLWSHAAILASLSPFLKGLLVNSEGDAGEARDTTTLVLPDVNASHMKKALEGLYRGSMTLSRSHLQPILDILQFLQCQVPLTEVKKETLSHSVNGGQHQTEESKSHKCVMCSKTFLHAQNLKIHLQSHLGLQVQLKKCTSCKRVFGRNLEYELHMNSHKHWQKLKHRLNPTSLDSTNSSMSSKLRSKILKRSIALLLKNGRRRNLQSKDPALKESDPIPPSPSSPVAEKKMLKLKIKNVNSPNASESDSTWCTICRRFYADMKGLKKHYSRVHSSHLSKPVELRNKSDNGTFTRTPLSNREIDLTCPTCDKVFVAYSIFQRHLKTSQHGSVPTTPENRPPPTPHMNKVLQPTILVRGKETPKYECHLCKQVFLRVKDLAKHRAKMCSAWVN